MYTRMKLRSKVSDGTSDAPDIDAIAAEAGIKQLTARVLVPRGYDTPEKIRAFLSPSEEQLHDPFGLRGMRELTERLRSAIAERETVVVYGDYDVDGICATSILTKWLTGHGVTVVPYIPSRKRDGYGITTEALERLLDESFPDLILTCDCGISAQTEIAAIAESGVDVIVTDHHEIPKVIPDCVVVDPKLPDQDYPFSQLCGAGVAFKIVQAMDGLDAAMRYIDLAAVATVADLVPLIDENRAIVSLGLRAINDGKLNPGLAALLDTQTVTASEIAYRLAPKINAAGRLGEATRALDLIFEKDPDRIAQLVASIDFDNERRKELCADLLASARALVRKSDLAKRIPLVLSHPDWEKGLTSIVAAQLASEYKRPTFLCVRSGDVLKGTARSVDGINLYELLASAEDLLVEFGGHAQAAGFSIRPENLEAFADRIDSVLRSQFGAEYFLPSAEYDADATLSELDFAAAKDIERLEPFGNGNPRPVFRVAFDGAIVEPMKNKPNHLVLKKDRTSVSAFGRAPAAGVLRLARDLKLNIEFGINAWNGREYVSDVLRDFDFSRLDVPAALIPFVDASPYFALARADAPHAVETISPTDLDAMLSDGTRHGLLLVVYTVHAYERACERFGLSQLWHSFVERETGGNFSRIVLAPSPDFDAFGYDRIVLLDGGIDATLLPFVPDKDAKIYTLGAGHPDLLSRVEADRARFVSCYARFSDSDRSSDLVENLYAIAGGESPAQLAACYAVMHSLGIVSFRDGISIDASRKRDLASSAGYRLIGEQR